MSAIDQGDKYLEQGKYKKARAIYESILEQEPQDIQALLGLATCLLSGNKSEEARKLILQVLDLDPDSARALRQLAFILIGEKKFDEVERLNQKALELEPESDDALLNSALISGNRGMTLESFMLLQKNIKLHPDSWRAHYNMGCIQAGAELHKGALREFWHAYRLNPSWLTAKAVLFEVDRLTRIVFLAIWALALWVSFFIPDNYAAIVIALFSLYYFLLSLYMLKAKLYRWAIGMYAVLIALILFRFILVQK